MFTNKNKNVIISLQENQRGVKMIELKDILKGLREQKQVSMDKMCEDLNTLYDVALAKSTISKWENGKAEPSLAYARILTKYFNVTLDYLLGLEKTELYNFTSLSKEETILLENYNKLNALGKDKLIEYIKDLIETPKYIETNNSNNVAELITATKEKEEFKPLTSFDSFTTVAAHYDGLTDEEKVEADRRILEHLNKIKLEEFNSKKKS